MARSPSADRYVVTVPVATTPAGRHQLDRKSEAARQQHNAVLGQLLRRHRAARRDRRWQTAASTRDAAERRRLYDAVCADVRLSERALGRWAMDQLPRCHLGDHLGCHETQATVARVWDGYQRWITRRAGPPRFRGRKRPVRSVQGTGKASPLRVDAARREVVWSRPLRDGRQRQPLRLALQLDPHDECHRDLVEALDAGRYTQTRLVRERINGRDHYHAQIVCVGRPPVRGRVAGAGRVGIDLGPAKVAVVTDQGPARLTPQELPAVADMSRELRRLQRRWDRQHRAGSPDCFGGDGTHVRGRCRWRRSARARRTGAQIADLKRRLRQTRKAATGRLVNQIAEAGGRVHAEDLAAASSANRCRSGPITVQAATSSVTATCWPPIWYGTPPVTASTWRPPTASGMDGRATTGTADRRRARSTSTPTRDTGHGTTPRPPRPAAQPAVRAGRPTPHVGPATPAPHPHGCGPENRLRTVRVRYATTRAVRCPPDARAALAWPSPAATPVRRPQHQPRAAHGTAALAPALQTRGQRRDDTAAVATTSTPAHGRQE